MSIRNAYHEMTSFSALLQAEQEVAKGKSDRQDVLRFEYDLETNLHDMSAMLRRMEIPKVWYKSFYVYTPKTRKVIYIDYTSKVIQRAAYDYINPKLVKTFIPDTYACIQDRGQLRAMLRAKQWMEDTRRIPGDWYYYKFDVAKFFYRIDHQVLLRLLEKRIGDRQVVELLEYYICNPSRPFGLPLCENQNEVSDADMLFEVGIPIGGGLSHMLGNLYLDPLDQYAKRELGCGRYIRYMDDIIIFDTSKERLKETGKRMEGFLNDRLLLEFNSKTALRPARYGLEFVGCVIHDDHIKLRKSTTLHMKRRLASVERQYNQGFISLESAGQTVASYQAMLKHVDMDRFTENLWASFVLTRGNLAEAKAHPILYSE